MAAILTGFLYANVLRFETLEGLLVSFTTIEKRSKACASSVVDSKIGQRNLRLPSGQGRTVGIERSGHALLVSASGNSKLDPRFVSSLPSSAWVA